MLPNSDWHETNFVGKITTNRTPTKTGNMETPHRIFLDDFREGVSHRQETVKTSKLENAIEDACGFRFR